MADQPKIQRQFPLLPGADRALQAESRFLRNKIYDLEDSINGIQIEITELQEAEEAVTPDTPAATVDEFRGDTEILQYADSTVNPPSSNIAMFDGGGNIADAGINVSDIATAAGLALKANIASPVFTGDPKAPTPAPGDDDTSIATTEFVNDAITAAIAGTGFAFGGDGSDGALDFDGTNAYASIASTTGAAPNLVYTLIRDIYATTVIVQASKSLSTANFRVLATVSITVEGTISNNGKAATAGGNAAVSAAGAAGTGGGHTANFPVSTSNTNITVYNPMGTNTVGAAGVIGRVGGTGAGLTGTTGAVNTTNQNTTTGFAAVTTVRTGSSGGAGGSAGVTAGGAVGVGGLSAGANADYYLPRDATTACTLRRNVPSGGSGWCYRFGDSGPGSGGAGAGDGVNSGGGSGGSGGHGGSAGNLVLAAPTIIIGAAGIVESRGGAGGNGGNGGQGAAGNVGGGGGGGGGNGGPGQYVCLISRNLTNGGTIQAPGGAAGNGGTGGAGRGTGNAGNNGTNGAAGLTGAVVLITA